MTHKDFYYFIVVIFYLINILSYYFQSNLMLIMIVRDMMAFIFFVKFLSVERSFCDFTKVEDYWADFEQSV